MEKKPVHIKHPVRAIERGSGDIVVIEACEVLAYPPVDGIVMFEAQNHVYAVSEKAFLHATE